MIRDLQNVQDDIIYIKRKIKEMLLSDPDIIEVLNNHELSPENPDDYWNKNIFPFFRIPGIQDHAKNFICFSVNDVEDSLDNSHIKVQYVQFFIICHADEVETQYDIPRHDLLAYFIKEDFAWTNMFGNNAKPIYNKEDVTDNEYSTRLLRFEIRRTNSLQRGVARNKYEFGN